MSAWDEIIAWTGNVKKPEVNIDPTETLFEIRDLLREYDGHGTPTVPAYAIVERFRALDEWLAKGGFLPEQWTESHR